jgi:hypothetical protein
VTITITMSMATAMPVAVTVTSTMTMTMMTMTISLGGVKKDGTPKSSYMLQAAKNMMYKKMLTTLISLPEVGGWVGG